MEGHCSTGQSPQWAVVPMEEEEEDDDEEEEDEEEEEEELLCLVFTIIYMKQITFLRYIVLQRFCSYILCYM